MSRSIQVSGLAVAFILGAALSWALLPRTVSPTTTYTANYFARYHEVVFNQSGACGAQYFLAPWSVTLTGGGMVETIVEPPNASLPISETSYTASLEFKAYSVIVFSVPNGVYDYVVRPGFLAQSGTVTLEGADVMVQVHEPPVSCRTQTTPG